MFAETPATEATSTSADWSGCSITSKEIPTTGIRLAEQG